MASGGVVGWQVDIPSLTNLVGHMGMEGLKKLQMSGVDIHTLGCLAVLGELTPATLQYRSQLQKCRQKQRSETWWIHDVVEFGCGTNFVVDVSFRMDLENQQHSLDLTLSQRNY